VGENKNYLASTTTDLVEVLQDDVVHDEIVNEGWTSCTIVPACSSLFSLLFGYFLDYVYILITDFEIFASTCDIYLSLMMNNLSATNLLGESRGSESEQNGRAGGHYQDFLPLNPEFVLYPAGKHK
jgi:hypothetical protein